MRPHVDFDRCQSNGLCVLAAPEVFDLDEANHLHVEPQLDPSLVPSVQDAVAACPVRAITLVQ